MAVELAQLALWISTFVPGLAMCNFDHGLVCADSLTGVGTLDEALHELDPDARAAQGRLLTSTITDALADAKIKLDDAAPATEADKAGSTPPPRLVRQARTTAEPARRLSTPSSPPASVSSTRGFISMPPHSRTLPRRPQETRYEQSGPLTCPSSSPRSS